ncbi:MAG: integrase core domain-containing protein [Propionibacteriaceae bacterium]|nr:integrase core domain-containing protein [Propionibacteriaceae bacterium]
MSGRGCQHTSGGFARFCAAHNVTRPLGRTGDCFDNAAAESFDETYKKELVRTRTQPDMARLRKAVFEWVERHYNRTRRHSHLRYLTIEEFELGHTHIDQLTAQRVSTFAGTLQDAVTPELPTRQASQQPRKWSLTRSPATAPSQPPARYAPRTRAKTRLGKLSSLLFQQSPLRPGPTPPQSRLNCLRWLRRRQAQGG